MTTEATRKFSKELNSGTAALAVLAMVVRSKSPIYGYQLGTQLAGLTEDGLPMNQGAFYPVLRSLEKAGLLTSETKPSAAGPPRRYYRPTPEGRAAYKQWRVIWARTRQWLDHALEYEHVQSSSRPSQRTASDR